MRAFQSAPLTKARGDRSRRLYPQRRPRFNPLPSQKQGETWDERKDIADANVSIRSPHKSKGRHRRDAYHRDECEFQSAPLTKARGDENRDEYHHPRTGFNPLPSQKQGETRRTWTRWARSHVSIRSPHKSKGRPRPRDCIMARSRFQSAPLTKARGDLDRLSLRWRYSRFQSAPLTKARGDTDSRALARSHQSFNPLPSQKQGETQL